jgi:hypothetical protein
MSPSRNCRAELRLAAATDIVPSPLNNQIQLFELKRREDEIIRALLEGRPVKLDVLLGAEDDHSRGNVQLFG